MEAHVKIKNKAFNYLNNRLRFYKKKSKAAVIII
jgi:hypothetical protein